jgi:hypothetical protein
MAHVYVLIMLYHNCTYVYVGYMLADIVVAIPAVDLAIEAVVGGR